MEALTGGRRWRGAELELLPLETESKRRLSEVCSKLGKSLRERERETDREGGKENSRERNKRLLVVRSLCSLGVYLTGKNTRQIFGRFIYLTINNSLSHARVSERSEHALAGDNDVA